jgi:hypothetical protein
MRVLTLSGLITDDGRLVLDPGFVVDSDVPDAPGDLVFVALDGAGQVLARTPLPIDMPCGLPDRDDPQPADPGVAVFAGLAAFPQETEHWQLLHRGHPVHTRKKPPQALATDVEWPPELHARSGLVAVRWKASHPNCMAALGWSPDGGHSWRAVVAPSRSSILEVDLSLLPGGPDCSFELIVTDGWTTERVRSKLSPSPERGWTVRVVSPRANETLANGDHVALLAYAYHVEERVVDSAAVHWHSSIDASLGVGAALTARLTPGPQTLSARAYGAEHQIDLVVANA